MPPLIALAVLGAGAYAGFRLLKGVAEGLEKVAVEVRERTRTHEPKDLEPKDLGTLDYDPRSDTYTPRR